MSLRTIVLADVLGISKLTKSFGIVAFVQGLAFIVGPPISGKTDMSVSPSAALFMFPVLLYFKRNR